MGLWFTDSLQAAISHVDRALSAALKARQRKRKRENNFCFSFLQRAVLLCIFMLADWTTQAAVLYAQLQLPRMRVRPAPSPSRDDLKLLIENLALQTAVNLLVRMRFPETAWDKLVRARAVDFLAQFQTAQWILRRNCLRQAAPSTSDAVRVFAQKRVALGEWTGRVCCLEQSRRDERIHHNYGPHARRWGYKFRQRWNCKIQELRPASSLSSAQVRQKDGFSCKSKLCHGDGLRVLTAAKKAFLSKIFEARIVPHNRWCSKGFVVHEAQIGLQRDYYFLASVGCS